MKFFNPKNSLFAATAIALFCTAAPAWSSAPTGMPPVTQDQAATVPAVPDIPGAVGVTSTGVPKMKTPKYVPPGQATPDSPPVAQQPSGTGQYANPPPMGRKVTDILDEANAPTVPAEIRTLPKDYLQVKKTHESTDADTRLLAARTALAQGSYQAALTLFNDLYIQDPHNKRALVGRAVAFQKLGQKEEALTAYELALEEDPKNLEALTNMLGLLDKEEQALTIEKLEQLRAIYPSNPDIAAQLGMVYGSAGDYPKALKYLDMANALEPGNANILYNRAIAYDKMGNVMQAADLYRQIVLLAADGSLDYSFPIDAVKKRLATLR